MEEIEERERESQRLVSLFLTKYLSLMAFRIQARQEFWRVEKIRTRIDSVDGGQRLAFETAGGLDFEINTSFDIDSFG